MNQFSISQLAQFSGIKAHTIRIWEQRYNALKPNRSEGNTRYYDNSQLRRLLNIASLLESGYKVSELCSMSDEGLYELIAEKSASLQIPEPNEYFISQLVSAGMNFDETHFEKIFSHALLRFGLKDTYSKILSPMLQRVGMLWASDSIPPAQEHFISNLLRQKLFTAVDSKAPARSKDTWLLFLPENEFHEIGLLFAQYMFRSAGIKTIYLGSNVPEESLLGAIRECKAKKLFLFQVHFELPENTQAYLDRIAAIKGVEELYIAGNQKLLSQLQPGKFTRISSIEDFEHLLQTKFV